MAEDTMSLVEMLTTFSSPPELDGTPESRQLLIEWYRQLDKNQYQAYDKIVNKVMQLRNARLREIGKAFEEIPINEAYEKFDPKRHTPPILNGLPESEERLKQWFQTLDSVDFQVYYWSVFKILLDIHNLCWHEEWWDERDNR